LVEELESESKGVEKTFRPGSLLREEEALRTIYLIRHMQEVLVILEAERRLMGKKKKELGRPVRTIGGELKGETFPAKNEGDGRRQTEWESGGK